MDKKISVKPIGRVNHENGMFVVEVNKEFIPALSNIEGFSHLQVVWWGNLCDGEQERQTTTTQKPYKKGPETLGIFATRSPIRPNPILVTTIGVARIDIENGRIFTYYIDAEPGTPVLDIKPYHPSERVKDCSVPNWCMHWPTWYEDSARFNWQNEFNF